MQSAKVFSKCSMKIRTFGRQPAACRSNRKDWYSPFVRNEKTYDSAFPEFCGEEPCRRLGDPQMLKDTHPHLFNIVRAKHSRGDNALRVSSRTKAPRLYGASLDKHDRSKTPEFVQ